MLCRCYVKRCKKPAVWGQDFRGKKYQFCDDHIDAGDALITIAEEEIYKIGNELFTNIRDLPGGKNE